MASLTDTKVVRIIFVGAVGGDGSERSEGSVIFGVTRVGEQRCDFGPEFRIVAGVEQCLALYRREVD